MVSTAERPRFRNLNLLPSALDVISLLDSDGKPYDCIAYETSRGCPYKCAFCEWGTGAIGTKMLSFSVERIRHDWNYIVDAGIKNIWLTRFQLRRIERRCRQGQSVVRNKTAHRPAPYLRDVLVKEARATVTGNCVVVA